MKLPSFFSGWAPKDIASLTVSVAGFTVSSAAFLVAFTGFYINNVRVNHSLVMISKFGNMGASITDRETDTYEIPLVFVNAGNRDALLDSVTILINSFDSPGSGTQIGRLQQPVVIKPGEVRREELSVKLADMTESPEGFLSLNVLAIDATGQHYSANIGLGTVDSTGDSVGVRRPSLKIELLDSDYRLKDIND